MNETWDIWNDESHDPALNMALDDALVRTAPERSKPLLRLYRWNAPAISIGFFQGYSASLAPGRPIVRRPTGGGLVDHARDVTYTVVAPPGHVLYKMPTPDSYRVLHDAVAAAMREAGVAAELAACCGARNDACFAAPVKFDVLLDGRKIAGAAQRRLKCGLLHQGSILLPIRIDLDAPLRHAFEKQLGAMFEQFRPTQEFWSLAQRLCSERYATQAWTQRFQASKSKEET